MKSITRINETIANGGIARINSVAENLIITSLTGASEIKISLPDQGLVPIEENLIVELPNGVPALEFYNDSGSSVTVKGYMSDGRIEKSASGLLSVMEDILAKLRGTGETIAYIPEVTVQAVAVQVLPAAAAARDITINHEYPGSSNYVWYGIDNTVSQSNWIGQSLPAGGFQIKGYAGALWAISDTGATEKVGGYTKS